MCGICGFTGQIAQGESVVRVMAEKITHRGPDSSGFILMIRLPWAFAG